MEGGKWAKTLLVVVSFHEKEVKTAPRPPKKGQNEVKKGCERGKKGGGEVVEGDEPDETMVDVTGLSDAELDERWRRANVERRLLPDVYDGDEKWIRQHLVWWFTDWLCAMNLKDPATPRWYAVKEAVEGWAKRTGRTMT